jgi:hypothetical protein
MALENCSSQLLSFSLYGALLISRRVLLVRLHPIIARLPATDERITIADVRNAAPRVVLSPTRQLILKICFTLMPFILVALVISRAVDMQEETHKPLLQALSDANANPGGLTIIFNLGVLLFFGFRSFVAAGLARSRLDEKTLSYPALLNFN